MIGMWKKDFSGNIFCHRNGLTEEQINFLKELCVGDRVALVKIKDPKSPTSPHYIFKKWEENYEKK